MTILLALAAACCLLLGLLVLDRPRWALVLLIVALFAVPSWITTPGLIPINPGTAAAMIVLPASLNLNVETRLRAADFTVIGLVVCAGLAYVANPAPRYVFTGLLIQWVPVYFVARRLLAGCDRDFVTNLIAYAAAIAGAWGAVEFLLGWHLFEHLLASRSPWPAIQERGGIARSETAFGHSIVYGGVLALCIPFVMGMNRSAMIRSVLLVLVFAGVASSLSRGPLLAACAAVLLSTWVVGASRPVWKITGVAVILGAAVSVPILEFYAAQERALEGSNQYRSNVFSALVQDIQWIGLANNTFILRNGSLGHAGANSIDSTPLIIGMWWGWLAVAVFIGPFVIMAWRVILRRATFAEVALVAQLLVLFTVAPITQYGAVLMLWGAVATAEVGYRRATVVGGVEEGQAGGSRRQGLRLSSGVSGRAL